MRLDVDFLVVEPGIQPEQHVDLIARTWATQYTKFCRWAKRRRWQPFDAADLNPAHLEASARVLSATCPVVLAVEPYHPEHLYGYCCGRTVNGLQVLHMVYVRESWRRVGLATQMLRRMFPDLGREPLHYTTPTRSTRHHLKRWRLNFNPYLR